MKKAKANGRAAASSLSSAEQPSTADAPMPSMSAVEARAEEVAYEVLPDTSRAGERGVDFITIVTLVIGIFQTIIQNCPLPASGIRSSLRRPTLRQRAYLLNQVKSTCDCCNMSRYTNKIYQTMLAHGSSLKEVDAEALVKEAMDQNNLLI